MNKLIPILILGIFLTGCTTIIEKDYIVACKYGEPYRTYTVGGEKMNEEEYLTRLYNRDFVGIKTATTSYSNGDLIKCMQVPNSNYWKEFIPNYDTSWRITK